MSTKLSQDLPDFPYSPTAAARKHLSSLLSVSHFVTTIVPPDRRLSEPLSLSCSDRPQEHTDPLPPQSESTDPLFSQSENTSENTDPLLPQSENTDPLLSQSENTSENTDPHPSQSDYTQASSPQPPFHPPSRLQSSTHSPSRSQSSKHPVEPARLQSLKQPPSRACSSKKPFVSIQSGRASCAPTSSSRSAWRRFKRLGNRFVGPLRSMGICVTCCTASYRAKGLCDDLSEHAASPGSSWYSSGEYPPDFIRAVLENNALFGRL